MTTEVPITESSNAITERIDVASPTELVALLQKCDLEIFNGFQKYKSLFHDNILYAIDSVAGHIQDILKSPDDGLVVFSGCGTSGRLGFLVSRTFNELQSMKGRPEIFRYLIAGGDTALFTSQEAIEDDPGAGIAALRKVSEHKKRIVFIGITCGLSAPYVAGQLDYCMDNTDVYVPVLLGFNPTHLARNVKIEKWNKTFIQVTERLESSVDNGVTGYIINPIVGPEPITGSSRMKSGSVTKIILETLCMKALYDNHHSDQTLCCRSLMECYRLVCSEVYRQSESLSNAVQVAGDSLRSDGSIYYLGMDSLALLGLIDASECPPTYGATLDDVRGFVESGYETLNNEDGDISNMGRHFRISLENFEDLLILEHDTIVVINSGDKESVIKHITNKRCTKVLLTFENTKYVPSIFDHVVVIGTPTSAFDELIGQEVRRMANQMFCEMAVKWCLNAISTGAHVLKGKVYRNIMIDVKVSNNKLFYRAVGILQKLGNVSKEACTDHLLRSIYDVDDVTDELRHRPIAQHIETATPKPKVVPSALVSLLTNSSIDEAKQALSKQPVICKAIADAIKQKTRSVR